MPDNRNYAQEMRLLHEECIAAMAAAAQARKMAVNAVLLATLGVVFAVGVIIIMMGLAVQ